MVNGNVPDFSRTFRKVNKNIYVIYTLTIQPVSETWSGQQLQALAPLKTDLRNFMAVSLISQKHSLRLTSFPKSSTLFKEKYILKHVFNTQSSLLLLKPHLNSPGIFQNLPDFWTSGTMLESKIIGITCGEC